MYLIDTNICIYIMNNHPPGIIRKCREIGIGEICVSSITASELRYGANKSKQVKRNNQRLDDFLRPFEVISYDEKASVAYGEIRSDLEKTGETIGPLDMLIAAHALSQDLILVTNNVKEFRRVKALKIENWA